ncbi:MAG: hypothetical protein IJU37_06025 [Desulfovibrio sp.]|nr:hypothetical protein [Desulfovibrio sp.]
MFRKVLKGCLPAMVALFLAACGGTSGTRSDSGLSIDGDVEVGGPWKPYDSEWKAQPRDLPSAPGSQAAPPRQPGASQGQDGLPTYGIPALQRPSTPQRQEPSLEQVVRREFPEPPPAPADAEHLDIQP